MFPVERWKVYHSHRLGSVRWVTDGGQNIVVNYVYEGFGKIVGQNGGGGGPYQFCGLWGYRNDWDAGLMHVGARYYEVETGRWMQKDPILGDIFNPLTLNQYGYCLNNLTNFFDKEGHQFERCDRSGYWSRIKEKIRAIGVRIALIAACYRACEDLYNEITNPQPPNPFHDTAHLIGAVVIIGTGVAVGGIIGGGAIVVGAIYGIWHLAKLLEYAI